MRVHQLSKRIIFLVMLIFGLSSCAKLGAMSETNHSNDSVDGGSHGRVSGGYLFNSFDDYMEFYKIFKEYNVERYYSPIDNDNFGFEYIFKSEGMNLDDVNARKYNLTFKFQTMRISLYDKDLKIELNLFDISEYANNADFFENLYFSIEDTKKINSEEKPLLLFSDDVLIAKGIYTTQLDQSIINEKLDQVLLLFNGGKDYVF